MASAQETYEAGKQAYLNGDFAKAAELFQATIASAGPHPAVMAFLGYAQLELNDTAAAVRTLKTALTATPHDPTVATAYIRACKQLADWQGILDAYAGLDLPSLKPKFAVSFMNSAGMALRHLGRGEESRTLYSRGVALVTQNGAVNAAHLSRDVFSQLAMACVGANDLAALSKLISLRAPEFFSTPPTVKVSDVADLREWCERTRVNVTDHEIVADIDLSISQPETDVLRYHTDAFYSAVIPDAEIVAGWDFVLTSAGEVLTGASYEPIEIAHSFMPHIYYPDLRAVGHISREVVVDVSAQALFLGCPESYHYGHWLVDFLPRLRAWKRPLKLAIPATLPAKHREALSYFGVTPDDLVECELGKRYRFRALTVASCGHYYRPSPARVRFVAEHLAADRAPWPHDTAGRRVFLTRGNGTRMVANAAEFNAVLAEFGFETIDVSTLTLAQQNDLFSQTRTVMGVFGTDLLTAYHMRPGTDLVELIWDVREDPVVPRTCAILGLRHHFVVCPVAEASQKRLRKIDRDITVDCSVLRDKLRALTTG